jgi:hypothetical protein
MEYSIIARCVGVAKMLVTSDLEIFVNSVIETKLSSAVFDVLLRPYTQF